eukprot:13873661-Ditylum_brightwellii.AAC.1
MAVEDQDTTYLAYYYGGVGGSLGGVGGGSKEHRGMHNPHKDHCHDSPQIEDKNDDDKSRK